MASKKSASLTPKEALALYYDMLLIRRFEERTAQQYGMGLIGGFCHLYNGQEAVVVGIQSHLKKDDSVITGYRDHGHMLACGMDPKGVMAELFGREGGYSKGKGGSMHMFSRDKNFYGGHGIVGAQVSLGTGIAFAAKYRGTKDVCVAYYGDGAANQGQVYESYNMASLWQLPVIFVIENNKYAMGTAQSRSAAGGDLYERALAYGIAGEKVDGMDILAMRDAAGRAVAHARKNGPYIIEAMTYRYRGHSMSDPAKYRTKEEVDQYKDDRDPLVTFKAFILKSKLGTEDDFKKMEQEIKSIVLESVDFANASHEPQASELYTDVIINE